MAKVLHIVASPRTERSHSCAVAMEFLKAYGGKHPGDSIETLDLWKIELPDFDEAAINAKFSVFSGKERSREEDAKWAEIVALAKRFTDADKYVFSVPMWNFGIPYRLKHFIDVINQPGLTFSFSAEKGYNGLLGGKRAVLVCVRGGVYSSMPGDPMDFQVKYLKFILGFMGIEDVKLILAEGMTVPGAGEPSLLNAFSAARSLAGGF